MMELTCFQEKILSFHSKIELRLSEPLARHTSFRIGGNAEVMAFPRDAEEIAEALKLSALMNCNPVILGAGTNVLAPDNGVKGIVICLKDCLNGIEIIDKIKLRVMAGVTMSRAAVFAASHCLSGLEFAHGIPGTVGGGVYMNAGAYGSEISQICESVTVMDTDGRVFSIAGDELNFSYRHSALEENGWIVVAVVFKLQSKPEQEIRERMKELQSKRSASQPLDLPSAGSAFKRPVGGYAAALIDQSGLKGFRVGNACVSEKHAGFIVNLGGATAYDVRELLRLVSDKVYDDSGIRLEPEIRIW